MGLAHAMILMQMPYSSLAAKTFTKKLIGYTTLRSMQESVELAKEKREYPAFDFDTFIKANSRFFNGVELPMNGINLYGVHDVDVFKLKDDVKNFGVRNSCFTSIAPTGTISFIADVSGGIEPIFALAYARKIEKEKDRDGNLVYDIAYIADRFFDDYLTKNYPNDRTEILEYTSNNKGSCQECPLMSKKDQDLFKTAQDLKSTEHLDVLEAVARMTSLSVSKCISKDSIINVNGKLQFIRSLSNNRKDDTFSDINVEIINKNNGVEKSKAFYYNGIKPCKTITLNNGIQFTATKSHKILSKDGWVMMDDVSVGLKILG
jgi:ribonucleoside-diphosphate reductase alpha chain